QPDRGDGAPVTARVARGVPVAICDLDSHARDDAGSLVCDPRATARRTCAGDAGHDASAGVHGRTVVAIVGLVLHIVRFEMIDDVLHVQLVGRLRRRDG